MNDLPQGFTNCSLTVTVSGKKGKALSKQTHTLSAIAADSSTAVTNVNWNVAGRVGDTFRVAFTLRAADGRVVSTNHYDLLIADQEKARQNCAKLAAEFRAIREQFSPADYYRFFPGLGGTNRFHRVGDVPPAAGR